MNERTDICEDCRTPVARGLLLLKSHSLYLDEDFGEHSVCTDCAERNAKAVGRGWPEARGLELSHTNTLPPQ